MWTKVADLLAAHQRFVLTAHVNPDGDALGSELALARYLALLGKEATILNSDSAPRIYRFLDPGKELKHFSVRRHQGILSQAEVIVVLDISDGWQRLGRIGPILAETEAIKLCIDHHPNGTDFVDLAIVDDTASATGELIFELIQAMGGQVTKPIAEALYVAILTDTGSFRFPKTSFRTHRIVAQLIAAGADPGRLYREIYEHYPLDLVRLKGHLMNILQTKASGQLAFVALDRATLKAYGVKQADLDGFASLGQQVDGVRLSLFFIEMSKQQVKVSLRSDGSVAINGLAGRLGGGGHPSAAGAIVKGNLDEVISFLVAEAESLLEGSNPTA
jgi:bifunctional oligoribonuclease and PAP phosphatase NrnA